VPARIQSLLLEGPAGKLEALLEEPEAGAPDQAWLVCHPHPLYGGTMHNKVVHRAARGARRAGAVVLRFNFRGVGLSEGTYDEGRGEVEDARAALAWLRSEYPELPFSLAGFSFGSRVILRLGCRLAPERLVALGFPTTAGELPELAHCTPPKIFIQSTRDEFGPKDDLRALFHRLPPPKRLIFVDADDHFFTHGLDRLEQAIYREAKRATGAPPRC
jgi:alpha/beta superfamily hydrolase